MILNYQIHSSHEGMRGGGGSEIVWEMLISEKNC